MTYPHSQDPNEARRILWNQFLLARALCRAARGKQGGDGGFYYTDTHAGSGLLPGPLPFLEELRVHRHGFAAQGFFDALEPPLAGGQHPGSWLLAGRLLKNLKLDAEIDVNDIDPDALVIARQVKEEAWVRYWTHDWFLFLRSRLALAAKPDFVFIDPPPDDARGSAYAIDAAILLDTLGVPYMISYPADDPQDCIDQIGRTGLELRLDDFSCGVLLGGGAESVLLDALSDLKLLARHLGGDFLARLPSGYDYMI